MASEKYNTLHLEAATATLFHVYVADFLTTVFKNSNVMNSSHKNFIHSFYIHLTKQLSETKNGKIWYMLLKKSGMFTL